MKATTVREVKEAARRLDLTMEELKQRYQMVAFLGAWDDDEAEVLVPDGFPTGQRVPVGHVL